MKRWHVYGTVVGSKYLGEFEANTKEEAETLAEKKAGGHISLCHQCSGECEDGFVETLNAEEIEG